MLLAGRGSVAALAMLEYIEQEQLLEKVRQEESWVRGQLQALQEKFPLIGEVRGIGFLWGIELVRDGKKAVAEAERVLYGCLENGLSFKVSQGNVLQLSPPLTITREEWQAAIRIIGQPIDQVSAEG